MPSTDRKDKRVARSRALAGFMNRTIIAAILRDEKAS